MRFNVASSSARDRARCRWMLLGAGAVVVLLFAGLMITAPSLAPSTSSMLSSVQHPYAADQPKLRLLNCPPGCERHGVCDREFGVCNCEWGWAGADCMQHRLPACRFHNASDAGMSCSNTWDPKPRSCECLRSCDEYLRELGDNSTAWPIRPDAYCFERAGMPPEEQLSDMPAASDTTAKYFRGFGDGKAEVSLDEFNDRVGKPHPPNPSFWLPLARCPDSCSYRGLCWAYDLNATEGYCDCWSGHSGQSCAETIMYRGDHQVNCFRNCSDAGVCKSGWCHCEPGRWGLDCSRTKAYAPHTKTHRGPLRIYIQELPVTLNLVFQHVMRDGQFTHHQIYVAFNAFLTTLLADWSVRTEDPWEADLIHVPAQTLFWSSNLQPAWPQIVGIAKYLRRHSALWQRANGADHMFWFARDRGSCGHDNSSWIGQVGDELSPAADIIRVTHFCYSDNRVLSDSMHGPWRACFDPRRDVCVAPHQVIGQEAAEYFTPKRLSSTGPFPLSRRDTLMFFNGGIRPEDMSYSGGVRQDMQTWFGNSSAILINKGDTWFGINHVMARRNATFCLAPSGHGWGIRVVTSVVQGCIPVIIQDGVHQPYEDVLPYWQMSIRLHRADIPQLEEFLLGIPEERVTALQYGVMKYYDAFVWPLDPSHGRPGPGRAYEYTLRSMGRVLSPPSVFRDAESIAFLTQLRRPHPATAHRAAQRERALCVLPA